MKFLKILGILALVAVALFLVVPFFLPKSSMVEKSIIVAVAPKIAYDKVADFRTWNTWDPFSAADPESKLTFTGKDKTVGFARSWDGKKIGSGTMTIAALEDSKKIVTKLQFGKEAGTPEASFTFEPVKEGTKVTWGYKQENLKYPNEQWMGLMMGPMLGGAFDKGLVNLKKVLETKK